MSDDAFYESVYHRGLAHFQDGDYRVALGELRIAAFGFVESIDKFETAEAYAAAAALRAHRIDDARLALRRIIAAEKIQPQYATIGIPANIRREIDDAAPTLLSASELSRLKVTPAQPQPAPQDTNKKSITVPDSVITPPETIVVDKPVPERVPQPEAAPQSQPTQPQPQPAPASRDAAELIAEGDRAIGTADLRRARQAYAAALDSPNLDHDTLMKIGEGLYRALSFRDAVTAFGRAGAFQKGEERFHYYDAVVLYEIGQYSAAKRELAAALPFIEITPDVERYRAKIEAAKE